MKSAEFEHLSDFLDGTDIGLGWLSGVSRLANVSAVSTRAHFHPHAELIFCLKGEFTYAIDQVGERALGAGSGILIPAGTVHALQNDIDTPGERLGLHLLARMRSKPDFAIFSPTDYRTLKTRIQAHGVASFRLTKGVMEHVRQLSDLIGVGKELPSTHLAYIRILACSILYDVAEATTKTTETLRPELIRIRGRLSQGTPVGGHRRRRRRPPRRLRTRPVLRAFPRTLPPDPDPVPHPTPDRSRLYAPQDHRSFDSRDRRSRRHPRSSLFLGPFPPSYHRLTKYLETENRI